MNLIDAIKTVRLFPKEEALIPLETRWGKNLDDQHVLEEYPRPQMIRNNYINLNGYWDYAITPDKSIPPQYQGKILVPFSNIFGTKEHCLFANIVINAAYYILVL